MPTTAPNTMLDPLHAFRAGAFARGSEEPVPLVSTRFDVALDAGLATVSTRRVFSNAEADSIEATITFPVPVGATLFDLTARIGGRLLWAKAQARHQARETYENAVERGKAAVLHEEVLRGVHMLSVAHIAPGAEIEVTATWAMPLDGRGRLRIPLTVGDIYGRSPLADSDDLLHGGRTGAAELAVSCSSGTVSLAGGSLVNGRASVPLNAPIDLAVSGWAPRELRGRAADGREVVLRIEPLGEADANLDIAVLVDRSGSMREVCAGDGSGIGKHEAVVRGLGIAAGALHGSDAVDLWEFDSGLEAVGPTSGLFTRGAATPADRLRNLAAKLGAPRGGTEIGAALTGVVARSKAQDIVIVTDGKSHALDVQALARSGRRFSAVLVGEDSLEANVGHLAAATGGQVFVVTGEDLSDALVTCLAALRHPGGTPRAIEGELRRLELRRSGQRVSIEWRAPVQTVEDGQLARAVAAVSAGLAIAVLEPEAATALATAEGLVTHLTSLVLVDEEGAVQEGQPASRRVALPTPRTAFASRALHELYSDVSQERMARAMPAPMPRASVEMPSAAPSRAPRRGPPVGAPPPRPAAPEATPPLAARPPRQALDLSGIVREIAWNTAPQQLRAGDLSSLPPHVAVAVRAAAADPAVSGLAARLRLEPVVLVLALLARAASDRSAARFAKSVLGDGPSSEVKTLAAHLGLGRGVGAMLGWFRRGGDRDALPSR